MENFGHQDTNTISQHLHQFVENSEVKLKCEIRNGCVDYATR